VTGHRWYLQLGRPSSASPTARSSEMRANAADMSKPAGETRANFPSLTGQAPSSTYTSTRQGVVRRRPPAQDAPCIGSRQHCSDDDVSGIYRPRKRRAVLRGNNPDVASDRGLVTCTGRIRISKLPLLCMVEVQSSSLCYLHFS
jgi:hypothetical protein